ncbi:PAS domain S-box-containing protein [Hydrogenophaga palleronii]|uniref:histidine kinase n=1 Tax=Hydrogenophaga palleronii TaxID=65655 RepID=A0ABU1WUR9_9BURK|nr:PAS domain S-box protein [Hydrogenophaga palleronii]MDR7152814.1 PAS domain S-box-containing protein [Hydrogenophaga palleronii]
MPFAPLPPDEPRRLAILDSLGVLDTPADPVLDGIVRVAALLTGCPVSVVSLVDAKRQWFKARYGAQAQQAPRELAFCAHAILQTELFEVADARLDARFADNPLVTGEPHVNFYAGVPLMVDGHAMGTLCTIDYQARQLTDNQRDILRDLAHAVEHWLRSQHLHEQLNRANAERRDLLDHLPDGVLMLDQDHQVMDANPAALQMLGYSRSELVSKHVTDLVPEEEHDRLARAIAEIPGSAGRLNEWPHRRRDGSVFWAEVSTRQVDARRFVSVLRDVTERRAQDQKLRLLSMAMEQCAESVHITDLDARLQYVNAAGLANSGYELHEMLGQNPSMLNSGRTPADSYRAMWDHLLEGKPWRGRFFNRRKNGVEYQEDAIITPIRDAKGQITQYLALMLDVTEKERLGQELACYQQHLEELVELRTSALVKARRAAEAASESKSEFLATMSHEIRTPMNGVVGCIDLLQRSALSSYQRELADTVGESALALLTIIDDILDFSKIEAGQLTLESVPVSLVRLTDSVCDALRTTATSRSVDLQVDVDPGLPDWILSDAGRLRQILNNLLGNAIKFSADTGRLGRVELRVQPCPPGQPGHLEIRVIDNGIGMAPEALQRIFQPFVQAEGSTTRSFGGTGLGLSICKRLTSMMGGWIVVDSQTDQGTTFTVTLPFKLTQEPRRTVSERPMSAVQTGPRFAMAGSPLVLLAEDNEINQKVFGHQLALLGLSVEFASDGLDALARWRAGRAQQRYALLLTDLHMPGMDGYTLAATIRTEERDGPRIPIVALSANALRGEIDRCRSAGMDDYLSKPVQTDQLDEMIKRWLPSDGAQAPERFGLGECEELDVIEVELSPCDYDDNALARLLGEDSTELAEFRQRFVLSALTTMDEMRRAAHSSDFVTLGNLAHRLKSSCRVIGAVSLAACCERIELAGPDCSATQMYRHMALMEDALAHVMTRLSDHIGVQFSDSTN